MSAHSINPNHPEDMMKKGRSCKTTMEKNASTYGNKGHGSKYGGGTGNTSVTSVPYQNMRGSMGSKGSPARPKESL